MSSFAILRGLRPVRGCVFAAVAVGSSVLSSAHAYAVSDNVRQACRDDYYQHCSQYSVGTEELRQCMRKVGEGLSTPCLVALVQEGEITKEDVQRHNAAKGGKNLAKTVAENTDAKAADDPKDVSKKSAQKKPKSAKTAIETNPAGAKKASKKATAGSKATPDKKTDKKTKATKKSASAVAAPAGATQNADKAVTAGKSQKSAKKAGSAKPSSAKSSTKKPSAKKPAAKQPSAPKKAKTPPEDQAP